MGDQAMVDSLKQQAKTVRKEVLTMIHTAGSGHPGGSLSAADIMTALYFHELNIRPEEPKWDGRDRFVLSKGHVCPVLYTCLALRGYFDKEILGTLRREGSILQGHPDMKRCPGIDISTGSLGQGISAAVGMALSAKLRNKDYRTYVLVGDGELQEGQVWEAAMFAASRKLDNLVVIVDNNGLQIDGRVEDVCSPYPINDKFQAFGFHTVCIDGHDFSQMRNAFHQARQIKGKPTAIIMKTVKGKGINFMERRAEWHGKAPGYEEYQLAMQELVQAEAKLCRM